MAEMKIFSENSYIKNDAKRIIFIGKSGVGKSTLLNMLYNDTIKLAEMISPALVSANMNGVSDIRGYYCKETNIIYIDTVGLTDNRYDQNDIINKLKKLVKNLINGIDLILFCFNYGRIDKSDREIIEMMKIIFTKDIYPKNVSAIITNSPPDVTFESWCKTHDNEIKIDMEFKNVYFINNLEGTNTLESFMKMRKDFLRKIKAEIANTKIIYIPTNNLVERILRFLTNIIPNVNLPNYQKLITTGLFDSQDCCICLQEMTKEVTITICFHSFHKKCLLEYLKTNIKCPICKNNWKNCSNCKRTIYSKEERVILNCNCEYHINCLKETQIKCINCGNLFEQCFNCKKSIFTNYDTCIGSHKYHPKCKAICKCKGEEMFMY